MPKLYYLNITYKGSARGIFPRRDKIIAEQQTSLSVTLNKLTYICKGGRINTKRLNRKLGGKSVITPKDVVLPEGCDFYRFNSNAFSKRLCANMALEVLRRLDNSKDLQLGIYDPEAQAPDLMLESLKICRQPVAVTCDLLPYRQIGQRALYELGASAIITRSVSELERCDLIIAPTEILIPLPIKSNAIVLTAGAPKVALSGRIYPRYTLSLPKELESIKPDGLDTEYFCSALYSLCGLYPLGSAVPLSCRNAADSQTVDSLCGILENV